MSEKLYVDILFTDLICPNPYEPLMLNTGGMGGSESTLLKVAESLGCQGYKVLVHEHNLNIPLAGSFIYLIGNTDLENVAEAKTIVHQRALNNSLIVRFPDAKHILWCHDIFDLKYVDQIKTLARLKYKEIVCVSKWHKEQAKDCILESSTPSLEENLSYIYNPVMDQLYDLHDKNTTYDKTKLVWLSSPHKDLLYATQLLDKLRDKSKIHFTLDVYNPGYMQVNLINHPYVNFRGVLPQNKMLIESSDALCLFMPMNRWLETFCLVAAEMNTLNVPVMGFKNRDALDETGGSYLSTNEDEMLDKVIDMYKNGRYRTVANERFKLSNITKEWIKILSRG